MYVKLLDWTNLVFLNKKFIHDTFLEKILTFSFITNAGKIADSNRVVKCGETNRHPCIHWTWTILKMKILKNMFIKKLQRPNNWNLIKKKLTTEKTYWPSLQYIWNYIKTQGQNPLWQERKFLQKEHHC